MCLLCVHDNGKHIHAQAKAQPLPRLARQGKDVLITSHKRVIARLLAEDGVTGRLPLIPPTRPVSELKEIGGFGLDTDPVKQLMQERRKR